MRLASVAAVVLLAAGRAAVAEIITDPSFFGPGAEVLDFDDMPTGDLSDQVAGIRFSSESLGHIGFSDVTDPDDTGDRFDAPMGVYTALV